ncbi:zinc ABC transporter ATP-binding protein AztA [Microbacterium amylolyticum]|uniref:Zinc/manganese transport system ATP-binding protein n=1 Tax=Microbacterium amylolyticum TaxID=936337 RepID=A0ABS4ZI76_9MICO|nr:zinc ABC transporter ATP-binding protein AztA [Microbacterium amylolyticum]MBP2436974.1 zinc/manganese transport system ATP-binding protein [Microbacterium amylolyticum]
MTTPALLARGVCFAYAGHDVLHDVDARLDAGVLTAIAGENGSGKSTLVEIMAGVRSPRSGVVERTGDIALVVQRVRVPEGFPLTVRETVLMGTWTRRRPRREVQIAVDDALARVGLIDLEKRSIHELSGGQRQRALIAQGIARDAAIMLFDEPAAGLDAESRERTRQILKDEAARGRAIGWVTHDDEDLLCADRVIRLEAGRRTGDAKETL